MPIFIFRMEPFNIRSITWNVAALDKPENFSFQQLLELNDSEHTQYDLYTIGFQEVSARADKYFLDSFIYLLVTTRLLELDSIL